MRLLVVEDEPLIRLGLASLLEDEGYEVAEAAHAAEAITILEADSSIRVVITDVDMPGDMDGIRLAQYVRHRWPPVQLLVISGKFGLDLTVLPSGSQFLSKPYHQTQILTVLRDLVRSEGSML
jgi:YesN/AraC family two-component response regulator